MSAYLKVSGLAIELPWAKVILRTLLHKPSLVTWEKFSPPERNLNVYMEIKLERKREAVFEKRKEIRKNFQKSDKSKLV